MAARIASLYFLSVLALLALLGAGVYLATEQTLVDSLQGELAAQAARDSAVLALTAGDPAILENTARTLAPTLGGGRSRVRVFSANGRLLAGPDSLGTRPSPEVLHALPPSLLMLSVRAERQAGRLYAVSPVAGTGGAVQAVVEVSATRDDIDRVLHGLGQAFALAAGAALVLALVAGLGLGRSIVAPVRRLEHTAAAIAGGDLDRRVEHLPGGELGALGASFNAMAEQLQGLLAGARTEQARLTAILSSLSDGVLACDAASNIILENPAAREALGVAADAPPAALAAACADLGLPALWQQAIRRNAPVEEEVGPAGRMVLVVAAPLRGPGRDAGGCVCILRDVTRLRETEQDRAAVLRRLAHELRTPLTGLQATISNLVDTAAPEHAAALAVVESEAARLARLTEELLVVARGPAAARLDPRPVDLRRLAADTMALFTTRAHRLGVTVVVAGWEDAGAGEADEPLVVRGDPDRLRQVLVNLLDNALRYTPAGGQVRVRVGRLGPEARLAVQDTGSGMDPATARWAFEPYYQGAAPPGDPPARPPQSVGLGLAIVREIATAHRGRLTLDTAPGVGTTVTVWLPLLAGG